ncbi:protein of unknown function [Taphrina deformans PYCC 5710]|uniref:Uncharacterized protein n=1 Tax=Taphrina deformans (strain PYCC 5710 / ATCC 11124 / CBS 356.35 / IMI 108563 / JCM 9778 / NBRC 8474) TaxID=1097556 RepID=R4XLM8_TAPDE|nr:protein of unknown function [Taphrina deformans PYCC 5710]|eukprot:CCG84200.1 protein of unknown function [Taphrina deformans PYCC 5710]
MSDAAMLQQQQAQPQQFESTFSSSPSNIQNHQIASQKANILAQQRLALDAQQMVPGTQLTPSGMQFPPGYLQAQMMRQRQAAAAAAQWAAQQERTVAAPQGSTQRLGSAILRLLNFSEQLNSFSDSGDLEAWKKFVDEFYVDPALCTQSLPANPELSYELPTPLLPAYFHQMHQDITKLNLTFHNAREYYLPPQNHVVECPKCTMCYYFQNATKIEILGKLRIVYTPGPPPNCLLKMESWEFIGEEWDEWICRMPPPPIEQNGQDEDEFQDSMLKTDSDGNVTESDVQRERQIEKGADSDTLPSDTVNEEGMEADHEDLFGRSPTDSNQLPSRPSSAQGNDKREKDHGRNGDDEKTKDPSKRARMVMSTGVTARHLRFLEISDVLGQLSPLFGQKSPKEALSNLLQSLPKLQEFEKSNRRSIGGSQHQKSKASQGKKSAQNDQSNGEDSRSTHAAQKTQQIPSGRAMQQQAAQVLQKQAAQTLSQALPPPNFDFDNSDSMHGDAAADEDARHEPNDIFKSNNSSSTLANPADAIKIEKLDEDVGDNEEDEPGDLDLDLDLHADVVASDDHELSFDVEDDFDLGDLDVIGSKRPSDEAFGRIKRQRNGEEEDI